MVTVYMNKNGIMVKHVHGACYAVFSNYGNKHICDRANIDEAIKIADSL